MLKRIVFVLIVCIAPQTSYGQAEKSGVGFGSAKEAFDTLRADPSINFGYSDGWAVATPKNTDNFIMWTFTPTDHAAHPAVIRREAVEVDGYIHIDMSVLCHAQKAACDNLVAEFEALNEKIIEQL